MYRGNYYDKQQQAWGGGSSWEERAPRGGKGFRGRVYYTDGYYSERPYRPPKGGGKGLGKIGDILLAREERDLRKEEKAERAEQEEKERQEKAWQAEQAKKEREEIREELRKNQEDFFKIIQKHLLCLK